MSFDAHDRSLRARLGAHTLHSRYDSTQITAHARAVAASKLDAQLLAEIDPLAALPEEERQRRLKHARAAHFARLALASSKARRGEAGR